MASHAGHEHEAPDVPDGFLEGGDQAGEADDGCSISSGVVLLEHLRTEDPGFHGGFGV